jgi:hypothetical protein
MTAKGGLGNWTGRLGEADGLVAAKSSRVKNFGAAYRTSGAPGYLALDTRTLRSGLTYAAPTGLVW